MSDAIRLSGLAGAVTLAAGSMAYADIVVAAGLPTDLTATGNTAFDGNNVFWDVDGDGTDDLEFGFRGTPISATYEWQANVFTLQGASVSGYAGFFLDYGTRLADGDSVASSGLIGGVDPIYGPNQIALGSDYSGFAYGGWGAATGSVTGFLGFQLSSGNYGWLELTAGPTGIQFLGAAYENSGADIAAGAVPTPGSLGALAIGAAAMLRRKRAA